MKYNELTSRQKVYVDAIMEHANELNINVNKTEFSRAELRQVSMKLKGKVWIPNWITHDVSRRAGRGVLNIPEVMDGMENLKAESVADNIIKNTSVVTSNDTLAISDDLDDSVYVPDDMVSTADTF
tara:strand:- start:38 stop:415 length:378 start_codon:yes stop_codon:yes gene_type:complete